MARRRLTPARPDYLSRAPDRKAATLDAGLVVPETSEAQTPAPDRTAASPSSARLPAAGPPIAQVSGQSAEAAALREVTQTLEVARATGRMVLDVPLSDIAAGHLTRDRMAVDDDELAALKASIRAHGQRTPAEISPLTPAPGTLAEGTLSEDARTGGSDERSTPDQTSRTAGAAGAWGLISGWRRLRALSELHAETGEDRFATIRALVRPPEDAADSYVAMVEENEVRVGLSYYERARIVAEATARGVFQDQSSALRTLFATASRAKRSKIASFIDIHEGLGDLLRFPAEIPERLGLSIVSTLRHGGKARLRRALSATARDAASDEIACLEAAVADGQGASAAVTPSADGPAAGASVSRAKQAGPARVVEDIAPGLTLSAARKGKAITLNLAGEAVDDAVLDRALRALRGL